MNEERIRSGGMVSKDLVSIIELTKDEVETIYERFLSVKSKPEAFRDSLRGKTLAMIFEKPSLRTRVTFEAGMTQLGGHAIYLSRTDFVLGERESVYDVAKNLERWVDGVMARTFSHQVVVDLAEFAGSIPVINGLTDHLHPCQALTDLCTVREKKGVGGDIKLAYIGDGNNVAHSLMYATVRFGVHVSVITPEGFGPRPEVVQRAERERGDLTLEVTTDPEAGMKDADVVYTDVWASMGQESEAEERRKLFLPYQVNARLMAMAKKDAIFMHCLPAHRGDEVTDEVIDSAQSVVFDQAENRLHTQKAIMSLLM
jgi:ornithine carbamoyltransferase